MVATPNDYVELVFINEDDPSVLITATQLASVSEALRKLYDVAAYAAGEPWSVQLFILGAGPGSLFVRFRRVLIGTGRRVPNVRPPLQTWVGDMADIIAVSEFLAQFVPQLLLAAGAAHAVEPPADPSARMYRVAVEYAPTVVKNEQMRAAIKDLIQAGKDAGVDQLVLRGADAQPIRLVAGSIPLRGQIASLSPDPWPQDDPSIPWPASLRVRLFDQPIKVKYQDREMACYLGEVLAGGPDEKRRHIAIIFTAPGMTPLHEGSELQAGGLLYAKRPMIEPLEEVPESFKLADGVLIQHS
jgi:hypothetical protein